MPKLSMISLFSGAGGLDCGLSAAGFTNKLCVEMDEDARKTLHLNNPNWKIAESKDIHSIAPADVIKLAGVKTREIDLLAGGPPCQPFSKSGYWANGDTKRLADPRSNTLRAYLEIVKTALPKIVLLENVKGMAYLNKDEGVQYLTHELNKINKKHNTNYQPNLFIVNSADYGVPQLRERLFILAHRDGKCFSLPSPSHSDVNSLFNDTLPYTTAWDAIGDLDINSWDDELKPTGKWAQLLPSIPEGQNYLWHTERLGGIPLFGWRTRYWSFLLKLAKNQPSWTIQAQPGPATGPFHWKGRLLSIRELARLQTFPDSYGFVGDRRSIHAQIGNAVPPAIGELFGLEFRRQFFGQRVRRSLKLIPQFNKQCPPPEHVKPVPKKYRRLAGDHSPHPGTGKGPRARQRNESKNQYA